MEREDILFGLRTPSPSKPPTEPPKTTRKKRVKLFFEEPEIIKKNAAEFRREYEKKLYDRDPMERFPEDQPGGTPLLVWHDEKPKFVFVLGLGREGRLVKDANRGVYRNTRVIQCQNVLSDPPDDFDKARETLIRLANRVELLRQDDQIENIGVVCYAGQNRSVSTALLFMMTYVYVRFENESLEQFALRLLTILTSVRPGAFTSLERVEWYGMKEQRRRFSWFRLVISAYEQMIEPLDDAHVELERLVIF